MFSIFNYCQREHAVTHLKAYRKVFGGKELSPCHAYWKFGGFWSIHPFLSFLFQFSVTSASSLRRCPLFTSWLFSHFLSSQESTDKCSFVTTGYFRYCSLHHVYVFDLKKKEKKVYLIMLSIYLRECRNAKLHIELTSIWNQTLKAGCLV